MPYVDGKFHDYFTPEERAVLRELQETLPEPSGLPPYISIGDFTSITLDGEFTLETLMLLVERLQALRSAKTVCACGHRHTLEGEEDDGCAL